MKTLPTNKRAVLEATVRALKAANGNRVIAAAALGVSHGTIYDRIHAAQAHGIEVPAASRSRKPAPPTAPRRRKRRPVAPAQREPGDDRPYVTAAEKRDAWRRYVAGGRADGQLRNELIEAELPALKSLAWKTAGALANQIDEGELLSEGAIALVQCAATYDPDRNAFWTYAARRALGQMLDLARNSDYVSRLCRRRAKQRAEFEDRFTNEQGRRPSDDETCAALEWDELALASSRPPGNQSTETVLCVMESGEPHTLGELLATCEDPPEANEITEGFFRDITRGLDYDQQTMLFLYFVRGASMKNIGLALGLSESRISQQITHAKAILLERIRRDRNS